ncbi:hypothetical protein Ctob_014460 [Chrysochromulina tobinii]|uniref:Uncharacterized protein n=1 Tax=Chrysochromulina tobinii TaxID=1460289 RepID=A0A0M0K568_9EUKA|nr:hypothetical protein Ctob_014460 [Chrysochromulina tobinii]|eukprot:KOO33767.1 hypothetical protein Ctob_014460 [Chrysochromulina sp. CCMP291]
MATTKTEEGVHVLGSGNTFERPLTVNEPCAFSFAFSVDGNLPLEFSVMLRAKGKDMQLLPASRYAELDGEVLLPGAGTCIARWHNPSGWVFNAPAATLYFKLQVKLTVPSGGALFLSCTLGPNKPASFSAYMAPLTTALHEPPATARGETYAVVRAAPSEIDKLIGYPLPAAAEHALSARHANATLLGKAARDAAIELEWAYEVNTNGQRAFTEAIELTDTALVRLEIDGGGAHDGAPEYVGEGPLPTSALKLLDELNLAKYKKKFRHEDLTEVSMFLAMLEVGAHGAADLRAILREVGMSLGHREKVLLALTTRPAPTTVH